MFIAVSQYIYENSVFAIVQNVIHYIAQSKRDKRVNFLPAGHHVSLFTQHPLRRYAIWFEQQHVRIQNLHVYNYRHASIVRVKSSQVTHEARSNYKALLLSVASAILIMEATGSTTYITKRIRTIVSKRVPSTFRVRNFQGSSMETCMENGK